jgi:hypothetical protein
MSSGAHDTDTPAQRPARARAFDLRTVLGGLFLAYGLVVLAMGLTANEADLAKASGVNINLWAGLAMLVLGGLFLLWRRLAPLRLEQPVQDDSDPAEPQRGASA